MHTLHIHFMYICIRQAGPGRAAEDAPRAAQPPASFHDIIIMIMIMSILIMMILLIQVLIMIMLILIIIVVIILIIMFMCITVEL